MKTPREILFARHRGAEPKLDEIRRKTLATLSQARGADGLVRGDAKEPAVRMRISARETRESGRLGVRLAHMLWREIILPCRRAWAGLAAVWLVLLALHFGTTSTAVAFTGGRHARSAVAVRSFIEEQRMLAELLQASAPLTAERPKPTPGPRSERGATVRLG